LESFEHDVDQRFEQRVARGNEFGLRLTDDQFLFKGDPGIAVENRSARPISRSRSLRMEGTRRISNDLFLSP